MLRDITIGQHFPGDSVLHKMDPRVKLLLTIAYIVMLFVGSNPAGLAISIVFLAVLYAVAKLPLRLVAPASRCLRGGLLKFTGRAFIMPL